MKDAFSYHKKTVFVFNIFAGGRGAFLPSYSWSLANLRLKAMTQNLKEDSKGILILTHCIGIVMSVFYFSVSYGIPQDAVFGS